MGAKPNNPDSLFTLPVVIGVIVVLGGITALVVSGLFVYRAQTVNAQTERIKATLQAEREREVANQVKMAREPGIGPVIADAHPGRTVAEQGPTATSSSPNDAKSTLKPGIRLRAQRPAHWDQVEVIDVLEDERVKVRWLSGEPGEAVIAADLVRGEDL